MHVHVTTLMVRVLRQVELRHEVRRQGPQEQRHAVAEHSSNNVRVRAREIYGRTPINVPRDSLAGPDTASVRRPAGRLKYQMVFTELSSDTLIRRSQWLLRIAN